MSPYEAVYGNSNSRANVFKGYVSLSDAALIVSHSAVSAADIPFRCAAIHATRADDVDAIAAAAADDAAADDAAADDAAADDAAADDAAAIAADDAIAAADAKSAPTLLI